MINDSKTLHDAELISAYLDGELSGQDKAALEQRLEKDAELMKSKGQLDEVKQLLHRLPARRVPHNFTISPKMAGVKPPVPRLLPFFRFASVVASGLFAISIILNLGLLNTFAGSVPVALEAPAAAPEAELMEVSPTLQAPMSKAAPAEMLATPDAENVPVPDTFSANSAEPVSSTPAGGNFKISILAQYVLVGFAGLFASAAILYKAFRDKQWYQRYSIVTQGLTESVLMPLGLTALAVIFLIYLVNLLFGLPG